MAVQGDFLAAIGAGGGTGGGSNVVFSVVDTTSQVAPAADLDGLLWLSPTASILYVSRSGEWCPSNGGTRLDPGDSG